jgi:GT2 family glycosyltransferase
MGLPDVEQQTYVVVLNWRGWRDTIACLESLFSSAAMPFRVVVCDNASGDGSLERIADWADGRLSVDALDHPRLACLVGHLDSRPRWQKLSRSQAEAGVFDPDAQLLLVDNEANLGFAAGNNVGLRLALAQPDMDCAWLLNNDTLVDPYCLANMRRELLRHGDRAVCGSMIHFFDRPEIIQAIGGNRFNNYTGVARCSEGRFTHESSIIDAEQAESSVDYLSGCSMLIPRGFLEEVGLMAEDYFLYYEEIDWFTRNKNRFSIAIAADAHLYHREGSSIGSPGWQRSASSFADGHLYRSRLIFMRKHRRSCLPLCYLMAMLDVAKQLLRGQGGNARAVISALLGRPAPPVPL